MPISLKKKKDFLLSSQVVSKDFKFHTPLEKGRGGVKKGEKEGGTLNEKTKKTSFLSAVETQLRECAFGREKEEEEGKGLRGFLFFSFFLPLLKSG